MQKKREKRAPARRRPAVGAPVANSAAIATALVGDAPSARGQALPPRTAHHGAQRRSPRAVPYAAIHPPLAASRVPPGFRLSEPL